jgi:hypothetical protein
MNAKKKTETVASKSTDDEIIELGPEAVIDHDVKHAEPTLDETSKTYVETETPIPTHTTPPSKKRTGWALPLLALIAGTGLGGWIYRDYLSGYFPPQQLTEVQEKLAALELSTASRTETATNQERIIAQLTSDIDAIEAQQAGSTGETTTLASDLAALSARISAREKEVGELKAKITQLEQRPQVSGTGQSVADTSAFEGRLAALEQDVTSLKEKKAAELSLRTTEEQFTKLQSNISGGQPYATEFSALAAAVPEIAALESLKTHAATGLPNSVQLAQKLRDLKLTLPQPTPPEEVQDDSLWSSFTGLFDGIITVKPAASSSWLSIIDGAASSADANDLPAALAALTTTLPPRPESIQGWINEAEQRVALEQAAAKAGELVSARMKAGN